MNTSCCFMDLPLWVMGEAIAVISLQRQACGSLHLKKVPQDAQALFSTSASKGTLVQGVVTYSLYFKKNRAGTKPHSMLSIISKLSRGLNVVLLKECNKYLFWGNSNVSRRLKYKKIVWDFFFFFILVLLSFSFRVSLLTMKYQTCSRAELCSENHKCGYKNSFFLHSIPDSLNFNPVKQDPWTEPYEFLLIRFWINPVLYRPVLAEA